MPASITLTVSHLPTSTSFFLSSLQPLNYVYRGRVNDTIGFGHPDAAPDFWITQSVPGVPPGPAHVAFPATSQRLVHEFFSNAIRAGARIHGEPALRDLQSGYYSAAVIDFDGNSIEAVYRPDLPEKNRDGTSKASKNVVSKTKSKAPTLVSTTSKTKAPTAVSSMSKASKAKTAVPTDDGSSTESSASRSPTETHSVALSTAPRSSTSKANSAVQQPHGDFLDNIIANAQGAVSMAKELVNQARPHMTSASGGNIDQGFSGAVVGALFGVAAGAALHYSLTRHNSHDQSASAPPSRRASPPFGGIVRSETVPSYTEERYRYYHDPPIQHRAIEAAPSTYHGSQRLIELIDNDPTIAEYTIASRPCRRSSLSELSTPTPKSHTSHSRTSKATDIPPTSYRAATATTELSRTPSTSISKSKSQTNRPGSSSVTRSTASGSTIKPTRHDEGYASASSSRSKTKSSTSRSSKPKDSSPSKSTTSSLRSSPRRPPSETSMHLPPRAATWTPNPPSSAYHSTHSHSHPRCSPPPPKAETVIGHLTASQLSHLESNRGGSLKGVTRSVVGKVREADEVSVSPGEVRPGDSVSQC